MRERIQRLLAKIEDEKALERIYWFIVKLFSD